MRIEFNIIKDSFTPTLERGEKSLDNTTLAIKDVFYDFSITAQAYAPVWTGDLSRSMESPINYGEINDEYFLYFGAVGGSDPYLHTDPENYAVEKELIYNYFSMGISEARNGMENMLPKIFIAIEQNRLFL